MRKAFMFGLFIAMWVTAVPAEVRSYERMFRTTFESKKVYDNPFADVDVDVVFTRKGKT